MDIEAAAHELLARSLLAQGRQRDAKKALEGAAELAERSADLTIKLEVTITTARVRAASGRGVDIAAACKSLEAAIADAHKAEFLGEEHEARLALGELELRSGERASGQAKLEALRQQAGEKGFRLIAGRAEALSVDL